MRCGDSSGFRGAARRSGYFELAARVVPLNRIDGVEHGRVNNGHHACASNVVQLGFQHACSGLFIPLRYHVGSGDAWEENRAKEKNTSTQSVKSFCSSRIVTSLARTHDQEPLQPAFYSLQVANPELPQQEN